MAIIAMITGQIRHPNLFERLLGDLHALVEEGRCQRVLVSTWTTETFRCPWLREAVGSRGFETILSPPITIDTYRNYRRQQHLLDRALDCAEPGDTVIKLRPDWVVSRGMLRSLCAQPSATELPPSFPSILRGRVTVPWWSTRVPFHLADESFKGFAEDLRAFNPTDCRLALADPHAGRYLPHLMKHLPVLRFVAEHVLPYIADSTPDSASIVRALGRNREPWLRRQLRRRFGPFRFEVTTMALDLVTYQQALACYYVALDWLFDIHNPDPVGDQFIDRHGPWSFTTPDVSKDGDPFQTPDPLCYRPEHSAQVSERVPPSYGIFHQTVKRFRASPRLMLQPPEPSQARRDAAELRRRVVAHRYARITRKARDHSL